MPNRLPGCCITTGYEEALLPAALELGKREKEGASFPLVRFDANLSAVSLDDPLANRKSDSCSGSIVVGGQSLEQLKYSIEVFGINTDAIIFHGDSPVSRFFVDG